ncbi:DUF883 domain-containing protein [Rugamonas sp.]|uniref:DUF883 family protein n=1 Tax=Rugamonas sp. TaxID=1926287 RepID=UPI0025F357FE|nr:DUF883 domain-containing protein [Rugamonas sp.]
MDQIQQNGKTGGIDGAEARARLMNDLKTGIGDVEHWLRDAQDEGGDGIGDARAQFEDTLRTAKTDLLKLEDSVLARTKIAARQANVYVQDHPWQAVGLGAAVGVIVGLLVARK